MARLNIAETRLPQDGRIQLKVAGREVDVRVSVIPMIHGEGIVLRLLDKGGMEFSLAQARHGRRTSTQRSSELIRLPHGIILVTGPTGSGKTHHALQRAAGDPRATKPRSSPPKTRSSTSSTGINQIQVHPKIGLTFAQFAAEHSASRPGHRADRRNPRPGNGRERHPGVADRPPGVQHAAHQRRGRGLHAAGRHGRRAVPGLQHGRGRDGPAAGAHALPALQGSRTSPTRDELPARFPRRRSSRDGRRSIAPVGCRECRQVGYRGRMGIFELLVTTDEIRQLAHERASSWAIQQAAVDARHAHAARGRLAQGARRPDDDRRSGPRHQGQSTCRSSDDAVITA